MKTYVPTNPLPYKIENDNRELWLAEEEFYGVLIGTPYAWLQYLNC